MINRAERARSFGQVAEDYGRLRPSPPDAAVDWLLQPPGGPGTSGPRGAGAAPAQRQHRRRDLHPVRLARSRMVELPEAAAFGKSENASFRYTRIMTVPDFLGLLATYSRIITAGPADDGDRARAYLAQRFPDATELEVPLRAWTWRARRT